MKDRYIGITQPLNIVSRAYANLDAKYGPYNSIENALENIPMSLRVQGLTVGIIIDNEIKEYWFKSGIENTDLVLKSDADLTSVFQALANKVDKEVGSFLMTQEERDLLEILGELGGTIDIDALKGLFLSKVIDDIAKGKITFEKGLVSQDITKLLETRFGEFSSGINTGKGGRIDEDGHGELESLIVRSFLEVPELRYNRLTLVGEEIAVGAGGIIEKVVPYDAGYRITLKLEEGEMNPFWYDDIVKGIYHHDNGFKTTWFRIVSPTDATRNTIDIVMRANSGSTTYSVPVPFMHIARWGNFNSNPNLVDTRSRQSVLVLSSKTGSITFYDGIDNYGNGYVNSQWGKPAGLEFINNFENLPIGQHDPVLYLRTLLVQDIFKVNHEGYQVTEYRDRGIWDLDVATGDTPYESTLSLQDEVWHNKSKYRCIEHHTTEEPAQDSLYWLFLFELGDGEAGQSSFKSTVFKRTNTTLTTAPNGGTYESPIPPLGGWTDGIPAGEEKLWASSRIFTSDGLTPQQDEWSTPRSLTDTANLQLQYSSEEIPGTPTNSPDKWSSTARVNTIWMATRTNKNGVWSTWNILQIKGEKGAKGDNGTSVVIKGKVDNPSELPSPPDVSLGDGYISEDTGDLWVYDGSTEESGATLGWLNVGQIQGDSSYIHIAWADEVIFNAENIFLNVIGFTLIDTNKKRWYGIYVDNLKEDANQANAHKYSWTDTKGEAGKDSHSDEFIYIRNNDANFGVAENIPNSDNTIDYIPPGDWTDDPVGVTSSLKYEWVCTRKFRDEAWGAFSIPSIWNIFVEDGADGKDSKSDEFIFKVNNNPNFGTSSNRPPTSQTDDYVPTHLGWTDDPTGPTSTNAYEWVCKRVFNTDTQTWSTFSIPSLWAKYSKDGVDGDPVDVATPYMAGEWEGEKIGSTWASTRQYKRTASSYPVVSWLKGPLDKPIYYFLKKEVTVDVGANSPNLDTENWKVADGFEVIIAEAIFAGIIQMKDPTDIVTAGLSGTQGEDKEKPAIWSGGDFDSALRFRELLNAVKNNTALPTGIISNFVINHDGSARIGKYIIDTSGNISIINPTTGKIIISISDNKIPTIEEITSITPDSRSVNLATTVSNTITVTASGTDEVSDSKNIVGSLTVPRAGGSLKITGTFIGKSTLTEGFVKSKIELYRGTNFYAVLSTIGYNVISNQVTYYNRAVDRYFNDLPAGTYTVKISATAYNNNNLYSSVSVGTFSSGKLDWEYTAEPLDRLYIGDGGIVGSFGNEYMSFSEEGFRTSIGGLFMFSGISSGGGVLSQEVGSDKYTFSLLRQGLGIYKLTHNIGHKNYNIVYISDIDGGIEITTLSSENTYAMIQVKKYETNTDMWFGFSVYSK